jgi:glyoxylate reductase
LHALKQAGLNCTLHPNSGGPRPDELARQAAIHDAVLCQLADKIDATILQAAAPRCRIFANCAVGYDNIDIPAAAKLSICITNTPDVLTEATADLTWALLLAAARKLGSAARSLRTGEWKGWGMLDYLGFDVFGKTLGIIGAGRIGQAVARRASGFNMNVLYVARAPKPAMDSLGARHVDLPALLTESDFVSLHVPLTPDTRHLINAASIDRMKPDAVLINTSRGAVIDESALIAALAAGKLGAVGLDVYTHEPAVPPELLTCDRAILLPHIGSATVATRNKMAEIAAANIVAILAGKPPPNPVIPPSAL